MSESPTPNTITISPWWALLLLPVGLGAGWLVGQQPVPKARDEQVAVQRASASAHGVAGTTGTASVSPAPGVTAIHGSDAAPADGDKPAEPEKTTDDQPNAELSQWTTLEAAMAQSERNGKPVMIDFNADWCPPCQRMKQQVFEDWTRGHAVQTAVIPVSIVDRAREEGRNPPEIENLQQRFQVDAFPTLIVFSAASGKAVRTKGFAGADQTVEWITQAARSVR